MVVAIGAVTAARDRAQRRYCEVGGEDGELTSVLVELAERF